MNIKTLLLLLDVFTVLLAVLSLVLHQDLWLIAAVALLVVRALIAWNHNRHLGSGH